MSSILYGGFLKRYGGNSMSVENMTIQEVNELRKQYELEFRKLLTEFFNNFCTERPLINDILICDMDYYKGFDDKNIFINIGFKGE